MRERTLWWLLGAVAVLGLLYLAVVWYGGETETSGPDPVSAVLATVREGEVREVRIRKPDLSLNVVRHQGNWRVNGLDADTATVGHLFRTIRESRVAELVSNNAENHPALGVSADSALRVRFLVGDDTTPDLLVGNTGPYQPSAYVRVADVEQVYVLRGRLRAILAGAEVMWRDKTVAAVDTAAVTEVRVRRDEGSYTLRRGPDGWSLASGGSAAPEAVGRLLGSLVDLDAYAFSSDSAAVEESVREVVVLDGAGDVLTWIRAVPSEAGGSWLARSARGGDVVYRVADDRLERVSPPRDSLTAPPGG